jgi:hypothetical protein
VGILATASLSAFWLLIMCGIWLFLAGAARIFTGSFSPAEIALTLVIGAASVGGLFASSRLAFALTAVVRVTTIVAFSALQAVAMWISFQPIVTHR